MQREISLKKEDRKLRHVMANARVESTRLSIIEVGFVVVKVLANVEKSERTYFNSRSVENICH